jgi:hypothetical protein
MGPETDIRMCCANVSMGAKALSRPTYTSISLYLYHLVDFIDLLLSSLTLTGSLACPRHIRLCLPSPHARQFERMDYGGPAPKLCAIHN